MKKKKKLVNDSYIKHKQPLEEYSFWAIEEQGSFI